MTEETKKDHGEFEDSMESLFDFLQANIKIVRPLGNSQAVPKIRDEIKQASYISPNVPESDTLRIETLNQISKSIQDKVVHHQMDDGTDYEINYEGALNQQQLSAILEVKHPLLVIAGAGSGKTRIITYKVSYLIEKGIDPSRILLLTFTRKAATEMLDRVNTLLSGERANQVQGGTFHAFANNVLRKYHKVLKSTANFTIVDQQDSADIIDLLKTELQLKSKKKGKAFPKKGRIFDIISKSRNLDVDTATVIDEQYSQLADYKEEIAILAKHYNRYKQAANLKDYDDLLIHLNEALQHDEIFRGMLAQKFDYILVDEFQDTNKAQNDIVRLLMTPKTGLTVVGDDSQSIYSFRGAHYENILRFPETYANCKVVKIETNFRSTGHILSFTNQIMSHAHLGFKKKMRSGLEVGQKPTLRQFSDAEMEADYVVERILHLQNNGVSLGDMAVLCRAAWHSNHIQTELTKKSIPYVVIGGIKFIERKHVKDILALLKLSQNLYDAVSWHRLLRLVKGVGKITASKIVLGIQASKGQLDFKQFVGKKFYPQLEKLAHAIVAMREKSEEVVMAVNLALDYYKPLLKELEDDYEIRMKDLLIFSQLAGKYNHVEKFLTDFSLDPPSNQFQDGVTPLVDQTEEPPLTVSTIHSAKGLEWHAVFVPFALDGLIPSQRSLETIDELEEERRLFYVACSRAKSELHITMPSYVASWDKYFTLPCRFLKDISEDSFETDTK